MASAAVLSQTAKAGPAFELIRACAAGAPPDELAVRIASMVAAEEDLCQVAGDHGLAALCCQCLQEAALLDALPTEQAARLRSAHMALMLRQSEQVVAGLEAAGHLKQAAIGPALALKGLAFAATAWPGFIPRPMNDLDFLLPADQVVTAAGVLQQSGFTAPEPARPMLPWDVHLPGLGGEEAGVELHWALPSRWGTMPYAMPSTAALLGRASTISLLDQSLLVPSPEDCLIIQIGSLARKGFNCQLSGWVDVLELSTGHLWGAEAAPKVDFPRLWAACDEVGLRALVSLALQFTSDLFGKPILAEGDVLPAEAALYARLQPILIGRLISGAVQQNDALLHLLNGDLIRHYGPGKHQAIPACPGLATPTGRKRGLAGLVLTAAGGTAVAVREVARLTGRLLVSRNARSTLREDLTICRQFRRSEGRTSPRGSSSQAAGGRTRRG